MSIQNNTAVDVYQNFVLPTALDSDFSSEDLADDIGDAVRLRIIGLCEERKISINKLCSISGVTQSTINNIVSGRNRSTTIVTIKKLCDGLGISIVDFFNHSLFFELEQEIC